jgi:hypothetical protein
MLKSKKLTIDYTNHPGLLQELKLQDDWIIQHEGFEIILLVPFTELRSFVPMHNILLQYKEEGEIKMRQIGGKEELEESDFIGSKWMKFFQPEISFLHNTGDSPITQGTCEKCSTRRQMASEPAPSLVKLNYFDKELLDESLDFKKMPVMAAEASSLTLFNQKLIDALEKKSLLEKTIIIPVVIEIGDGSTNTDFKWVGASTAAPQTIGFTGTSCPNCGRKNELNKSVELFKGNYSSKDLTTVETVHVLGQANSELDHIKMVSKDFYDCITTFDYESAGLYPVRLTDGYKLSIETGSEGYYYKDISVEFSPLYMHD